MTGVLPGPLVDADWLADHLGDVVVADVRWYLDGRSGRAAYGSGHLPGAVFVDLDTDLSAPASQRGGRHPLPAPEVFAGALGRLGIGTDMPVVAYDDAGGSVAARLWWLRSLLGEPTAVLDGGLTAWSGTRPLDTTTPTPEPVERPVRPWPAAHLADADEVAAAATAAMAAPRTVVLDARAAARYRGEPNDIDARPGHIPGALSAPWAGNLDPGTQRFLPPETLRERYEGLGIGSAETVVAYCGSGVTACHDLLALDVAGLTDPAGVAGPRPILFPGSWSAWAADRARPIATGS